METDYCSVHNRLYLHQMRENFCEKRKKKKFIFQESEDFACSVLNYLARFELFLKKQINEKRFYS